MIPSTGKAVATMLQDEAIPNTNRETSTNAAPDPMSTHGGLYPSIEGRWKDWLYRIYKLTSSQPVNITGTVKLHGTHADIRISPTNDITFHSRNRQLAVPRKPGDHDIHGFAAWGNKHSVNILKLRQTYLDRFVALNPTIPRKDVASQEMIISGEWIGKGVQRHVAISQLELSFVVISVHINGSWVKDSEYPDIADEEVRIYNISRGGYSHETIDVGDVEAAYARIMAVTKQVDERCPFAATFLVNDKPLFGHGEGIVWKCDEDPGNTLLWFKTKGTSHMPRQNVAPKPAKEETIAEKFVRLHAHERRMEQGLEYLAESNIDSCDRKNGYVFAEWVVKDLLKEERTEIIELSMKEKEVERIAKSKALKWYNEDLSRRIAEAKPR